MQTLPAVNVVDVSPNRLTRKRLLDQIVQSFWCRWRLEYLHLLQERQKWCTPQCPIRVGMVVLVASDNIPPLIWPLGIIEEVFPGKDGIIRSATVKTNNTSYVRPTVRLCPLPSQ